MCLLESSLDAVTTRKDVGRAIVLTRSSFGAVSLQVLFGRRIGELKVLEKGCCSGAVDGRDEGIYVTKQTTLSSYSETVK